MGKKSLLIVKVNPIVFPSDKQEKIRKQIIKQLKDGVILIDKSCTIECYEYDTKHIEVKVVEDNQKVKE